MSSARREMFGGSGVSSKRPESRSVLKGPLRVPQEVPGSADVADGPPLTLADKPGEERDASTN
eukprot:8044187-Alexandrium_andersonii.AAC.1